MILFGLRDDEFDQVCRAAWGNFLRSCGSGMSSPHLLQLLPGRLIGIKLQCFAWMNFLPIQPAFGIATEDCQVDPYCFIVGIKDDHPTLKSGWLAHITPFKPLLK